MAASLLRSTYGCTPREAALALTLAQGCTLAKTAGMLGISIHTARTHLKRVFRKTGTKRQTELLRLMLLARHRRRLLNIDPPQAEKEHR